jgi:hypothetical protein
MIFTGFHGQGPAQRTEAVYTGRHGKVRQLPEEPQVLLQETDHLPLPQR